MLLTSRFLPLTILGDAKATRYAYCGNTAQDITEKEKEIQLKKWIAEDQSWILNYNLFSSLSKYLFRAVETKAEIMKGTSLRQRLPLSISKGAADHKDSEIMDRATCPWYIEFSYDPLRYPRRLLNAKCRCRKCKHSRRSVKGKALECLPITVKVKILRRKELNIGKLCHNGKVVYENTWEEVNIGCTCVFRRTRKQPKIKSKP